MSSWMLCTKGNIIIKCLIKIKKVLKIIFHCDKNTQVKNWMLIIKWFLDQGLRNFLLILTKNNFVKYPLSNF